MGSVRFTYWTTDGKRHWVRRVLLKRPHNIEFREIENPCGRRTAQDNRYGLVPASLHEKRMVEEPVQSPTPFGSSDTLQRNRTRRSSPARGK